MFIGAEITPLARRQIAEYHLPMRMRFSPTTRSPTSSHMRRIWRFFAFLEHKPQLILILPADLGAFQRLAIEAEAEIELFQPLLRQAAGNPHQIFLFDIRSSPINCLAIRPSCVNTSSPTESISSRPAGARFLHCSGLNRMLLWSPRQWFLPLPAHTQAGNLFGLARYVADRFVDQDRDAVVLCCAGLRIECDLLLWQYLAAKLIDHHAIDLDPALAIYSSASRREQRPSSAIRLERRIGFHCESSVQ